MRVFLSAVLLSGSICTAAFSCGDTHVVQSGDTLSEIALRYTGTIFATGPVFDANRDVIGDDPDRIQIGMQLVIPCGATSASNPIDWTVMPDAATLALIKRSADVQLVDIRSKKAISNGVIPGAMSIPYAEWRGPKENPGAPPPPSTLSDIIGQAGLRLDVPIVIIHDRPTLMDSGRGAVIYWLLKSSGAENLAILRGGHKAWVTAGLPIAETPIVQEPYLADINFSDAWRADAFDVYSIATGQVQGHLLDARPYSFFRRLNDAGVALGTTLPGATNAPVQPLLSAIMGEVDVETGVKSVIDHLGRYEPDWQQGTTISFCNTGELSALNWFYASELAGLEGMRLYPESVRGWTDQGGILAEGAPQLQDN